MYERIQLAPETSAATTHPSVQLADYDSLAFEFVVDVAGGTPTITWKVEGSPDEPDVDDADSHWYDVFYLTDGTDTPSKAALTATAVGAQIIFLDNPLARRYRKYRLVTTSDTNVSYHADAYRIS